MSVSSSDVVESLSLVKSLHAKVYHFSKSCEDLLIGTLTCDIMILNLFSSNGALVLSLHMKSKHVIYIIITQIQICKLIIEMINFIEQLHPNTKLSGTSEQPKDVSFNCQCV